MTSTATVTILFTDVVGSSELRTSRGDESAHQIMETHFDLVRKQIEHHSGQEVKTMGDSFMVAFGSARSAVNCAVAVQQALAEHNHKAMEEQIHVRIGMNTGEAIEKEGDLFGSAVDAAARVMSKAAGGQILIPENTRDAIGAGEEVTLLDRGPFWLKGFPERWRLYEVLWHGDKISTAAVLPHVGKQTPFVGRESERADLRRYLDAARGGHGSLVMIGGEPGAGKTRITEELAAEADRHGFLTLTGHCYEMEGAPPYIPFVEILQSAMRTVAPTALLDTLGSTAPEAAKLVPELRERFPDVPEPRKLAPEQERLYLFNNLCDFFERMANRRPLLMVIEDLHWTDESTMLLLQHIAHRLQEIPALIVGTYRDTELDVARSLAKALEELLRQRLAHDVILRRLPETDVAAMLKGHSEQEPPTRLVELIYRETEGNPFFVEEVFKHFAEEGKLFDAEGGWRSDIEIDEAEVPRGVRLVIGRRLERVSEECRRTLTAAAIIGRGFSFDLLEELLNLDEDALFDAIEAAEQAQLITSKAEGGKVRFIFSHELIRQTLVSSLSLPRRQRSHLRVAETLERLYAETLEQHSADLAYHYYQGGGDMEKTIEYSVLAAERATAQIAYEEAVNQYERALRAFEQQPIDEVRHCDLMLALGDAYANVGDRSQSEQTFLNVIDIARKVPEPERFAEAVLGFFRFYHVTSILDDRMVRLLEEGLELLPEKDSAFRAAITGRLSILLGGVGLDERRFALSDQAVEMARRVGDPKALFYGLFSRTFIRWGDCTLEERIAYATELAEFGMEAMNPEGGDWGLAYRCSFYLEQGNISASDADLALLKSRGRETGSIFNMWIAKHTDATRACMSGRFDEAEQLAIEALSIGAIENAERQMQVLIYTLRWLQGRLGENEEATESDIEQKYSGDFVYDTLYAHMKAALGKKEDARAMLERLAVHDFADVPRYWGTTYVLLSLSQVAIMVGETDRAARLYDLLHPYKDRLCIIGTSATCHGAMALWLGMLAAMLKRWDDAVEHFEAALETTVRIGMRPWLARTQHEYARMLIERDDPGDQEKAKELLSEATDTYRELGMPTFLEDAEELMGKL